jgi:hypothetical protein
MPVGSVQKPFPPVYYPSALVNFTLRFDEALTSVFGPNAQSSDDLSDKPNTATVAATKAANVPSIIGGQSDNLSFVVGRIPQTMNVELTGYRQAWRFDMTFEYQDLPIDPRLIRAASVRIHLDAVESSEFAAGMRQRISPNNFQQIGNRTNTTGSARRRSMLDPTDDNTVLVGIVDDACSELSGSMSTIRITGRDLRGILLDSKVTNLRLMANLDLTKSIDKVIKQILSRHPFGDRFVVEALEEDWEGQVIPSPATASGITRVNLGANGRSPSLMPAGAGNLNYWDLITNYCFLVGAIPYFHVNKLRVRPARSLFTKVHNNNGESNLKSPFKNGLARHDDNIPNDWKVRKLVYGRDIKTLKFERKYVGFVPKTVRAVCMDTSNPNRGKQKLLIADWPTDIDCDGTKKVTAAKKTHVASSGTHAEADVLKIPIHGINDINVLRRIAKDVYEEIGRGEMGGSVETENLASFGGDNQDPDLVRLRPGDTVELIPDVRPITSILPLINEFTDLNRLDFESAVKKVKERVGDEKLARAILATSRATELQRFFRVANVRFTWGTSGLSLAFDYQNYVEARNLEPCFQVPITKRPKREVASVGRK